MPAGLSALLLLLGCTALNIWGLKESTWVNIIFTSIEVGGLLLVIVIGLMHGDIAEPLTAPVGQGVIPAAALLFFVYLGFEEIANLSEEVRDPGRDLPRALFLSIAITTALYVLVSLAVVVLASPDDLARSDAPLALSIQKTWPAASGFLSAIALFATANTVLITLIATSRLAFSMGRDRELPAFLATLLPGRDTPWIAALTLFAMSAALLPLGDVKILAELSSFSALLAFLAVNLALIVLRYRQPKLKRPFRVPLKIGRMPLVPLVAMAAIAVLLAHFDREIYLAGGAALILTFVAFLLRRWLGRIPKKRAK